MVLSDFVRTFAEVLLNKSINMAKKENEGEALNPQQEKLKALQAAMSKSEKDFGKGSIMKLGDEK